MKIICLTIVLVLLGITACQSSLSKKNPIPPLTHQLPFESLSLKAARAMALDSEHHAGQSLLILLIDQKADPTQTLKALGFRPEDQRRWKDSYLAILLHTHEPDAQELIEQYQLQGFPAVIKEWSSIDRVTYYSEVKYGALPQVSDKSRIYVRPIAARLYNQYQSGNRHPELLLQTRDYLAYLDQSPEAQEALYTRLTNDYLNSLSKTDLETYRGYRILKKEAKDVRYDVIQKLLADRTYYNARFVDIAERKQLKNRYDADWIIEQAILHSYQKAARQGEISLFERTIEVNEAFRPGYRSEAMLKAILAFHVTRGEEDEIRFAALNYLSKKHNWTTTESYLLEASAIAINETSDQLSEWQLAEQWMEHILQKTPNPTNYRLQMELLKKIGDHTKWKQVANEIKHFRSGFTEFKNYYPKLEQSLQLEKENISAPEFDKLNAIPTRYRIYYRYIARESSLYKKGEAIQPMALLHEDGQEVILLTRVHLATGSILPVTHYRSYYIQSRFSLDGEHLESVYVDNGKVISSIDFE